MSIAISAETPVRLLITYSRNLGGWLAISQVESLPITLFGITIEGRVNGITPFGARNDVADGGQRGWRYIEGINMAGKPDLRKHWR